MKKLNICFSVMLLCITAAFSASAQTETRNVSGYTGIECSGPFTVRVKIDGTETLKLDVDADALADIETVVEGGVLKVGFKNGWKNHRNIKRASIYITAKTLNYLANGGSGNTVLDGTVTGDNAKLAVSGSGNLRAAVKAKSLELAVSGSGGLITNGSAESAEIRVSGSGEIDGKQLTVQTLNARVSGSGGVTIVANQTVSARVSGSGSVEYAGNAKITESHTSGSGRVNKVDF